jgi:hypothetical protein
VKLGSEACSSSSARWASTDSVCNSTSSGGWCYSTGDSFMPAYAVTLIEHQSPNEALWFAGNLFTLPFWHVASLDWSDADTVTYKSLLLMLLDNVFVRLLNICKRKGIGWNLKLYFVSIWDFGIAAAASLCVRAKDAILSMSERQAVLRCLVDYTCIGGTTHEQVNSSWDCISNHCCCYYHHMYTDRGWGCMWINYYPVLFTMKSLKHSH